jgi:multidrug efflux system outer membrane protein
MREITMRIKFVVAPLLAAMVLVGCATAPLPANPDHALPAIPAQFKEDGARFTTAMPAEVPGGARSTTRC